MVAMNTSDKIFIEFAKEYRKELDESAPDEKITDAFNRLVNVLRVLDGLHPDERFDPSSCVDDH